MRKQKKFSVKRFDVNFHRLVSTPYNRKNEQDLEVQIDPFVLQFFKSFGDTYQTRMSAVLRAYVVRYGKKQ